MRARCASSLGRRRPRSPRTDTRTALCLGHGVGDQVERRLIDRLGRTGRAVLLPLRRVFVDRSRNGAREIITDLRVDVGLYTALVRGTNRTALADLHGAVVVAVDGVAGSHRVAAAARLRDRPVPIGVELAWVDEIRAEEAQQRVLLRVDRLVWVADYARVAIDDAGCRRRPPRVLAGLADRHDQTAVALLALDLHGHRSLVAQRALIVADAVVRAAESSAGDALRVVARVARGDVLLRAVRERVDQLASRRVGAAERTRR